MKDNRRDLLIAIGQIRTELGFLHNDMRLNGNKKDLVAKRDR